MSSNNSLMVFKLTKELIYKVFLLTIYYLKVNEDAINNCKCSNREKRKARIMPVGRNYRHPCMFSEKKRKKEN